MTTIPPRPRNRNDFKVAIICALPIEARMVTAVFDRNWKAEGVNFDQAENDHNTYTLGVIGRHNVVLVHMPGMGSVAAATAAAKLHASFPRIDMAFLVGICGASPNHITTKQEICLGDCIVSTALIQYRFGRQYPGRFSRKVDVEDVPSKAGTAIGSLLAKLRATEDLRDDLAQHLQVLQEKEPRACCPGAHKDRLFDSAYSHTHRNITERCNDCVNGAEVCTKDCSEIGCNGAQSRATLIAYENTQKAYFPRVHFGRYGSADTVLKSGTDRDEHIENDKIIAFEMEAAGIWDSLPTLVVKSACDYADSHKSKEWQDYAAATAAAALKAILGYWRIVEIPSASDHAGQTLNAPSEFGDSIQKADQLVRDYYRTGDRLLIKRLSGQELDLKECYINLALVDRSIQAPRTEQTESSSLEARLRLDASDVGPSVPLLELFKQRKLAVGNTINPRRIFIQGRAGIGKTTLCKKIVYEFLDGRLGNELFTRLLWIPLRGLKSNQHEYGWQELLRDTFRTQSDAWKEVRKEYAKQFEDSKFLANTLFLFDGLDEISYQWNDDDPMCNLIDTIIRHVPNVIITSRPRTNTFSLDRFDLDLETLGFTIDQVSVYIKHCIADTEQIAKMEGLLAQKPLLRGLLRIPIQLDAFCYIWDNEAASNMFSIENFVTMTTIYQSIFIELCKKDLKILGRLDLNMRPPSTKIQDDFKREIALLCEIAFQGMSNNLVEFYPQHWDKLGSYLYKSNVEYEVVFSSTLERLSFLRTSDHGKDYTKRTCHFIHLTFQEFFAAKHFVEHWYHDKALICIHMKARTQPETKTPFTFLQEEKYNPRYNIFWRFVAGFISGENDMIRFWGQLQDEPTDLFGFVHLRLLMSCYSELLPYEAGISCNAHNSGKDLLRQGLVRLYQLTGSARIGMESEFPEEILRSFLENDSDLSMETTLTILKARPMLQPRTVKAVVCKMDPKFALDINLQAAEVLWKHSAVCSQEVLERAMHVSFMAFQNGSDWGLQKSIRAALNGESSVSKRAVDFLVAALVNQDHFAGSSTAITLGQQSSISEEVIDYLIAALRDDDWLVSSSAAHTLGTHSYLSTRISNLLLPELKDEDNEVRVRAAKLLERLVFLSEEVVDALIVALRHGDPSLQLAAAQALAWQTSLPQQAIDILIVLLKGNDEYLRNAAAEVLGWQSSSSGDIVSALVEALRDNNNQVRRCAAMSLGFRSTLSKETISALIAVFNTSDRKLRNSVVIAFMSHSFVPEVISTLVVALTDADRYVRTNAAVALSKHPALPEEAISSLVAALKDEYAYVQIEAANALVQQSSLPDPVIATLLTALDENYCRSRSIQVGRDDFLRTSRESKEQAWMKLWSVWLNIGLHNDMSCYVSRGIIYLWSNGVRHQISTDPTQTLGILKILSSNFEDISIHKVFNNVRSTFEDIDSQNPSRKRARSFEPYGL